MFERVANFRDLGGYRTRDGRRTRARRLYRSASLDSMTRSDARFACAELGVRTVIDLRAAHEVQPLDGHPLYELGVERVHAPLSNEVVQAGWSCLPAHSLESHVLPLQHARGSIREAVERLTRNLAKRLVQVPLKGLKGAAWNHSSAVIDGFLGGLQGDRNGGKDGHE